MRSVPRAVTLGQSKVEDSNKVVFFHVPVQTGWGNHGRFFV